MVQPLSPPVWVATQTDYDVLVKHLSNQISFAIDTESNSLYAYQEKVCLIQISTADTDFLVDPLALDDISSIGELLADSKIEKIFHAAEYDLICLKRDFNFLVANIFDTRWAVRVLGYEINGLDRLLLEKFDVKVNKKYQKADWGKRPLSAEEINYARQDTHYLLPLKEMLLAELEEKNLTQLASEDFVRACKVVIPIAKPMLWERRSKNQNFTPRELTILKEVYECRDNIAKNLDRPPFKVMADKQLLELAWTAPQNRDDLLDLGLSSKQVKRWGKSLIQAVKEGQTMPIVKPQQTKRPNDAFLSRLDTLKMWRKNTARQMKVESDVVMPRQLLERIAEIAPSNIPDLTEILAETPWRLARYGSQILSAVNGES